jgi:uncharacterized protein (DUF58 family)
MLGWLRQLKRQRQAEPAAAVSGTALARADMDALLRQLDWTVLRRLDGALQGDHRSLFRGAGLDLADLREYQPHDDVRHIDWNVTARLQVPHVREHQEDREVSAWFLLDMTGSMGFGSQGQSKRALMLSFVGVMAQMLMRRGNRVGALMLTADPTAKIRHVPARMGRRHLLHLMDTVHRVPLQASHHETALGPWLHQAQSLLKRRSQVFVLSDFLSAPGWEKALSGLARRHDGIAVRLSDPLETRLPAAGLMWLEDAESGEQLLLDTSDPAFRQRYADLALAREAAFHAALTQAGMDGLALATDEDLALAVRHFVALRKRRSLHA